MLKRASEWIRTRFTRQNDVREVAACYNAGP